MYRARSPKSRPTAEPELRSWPPAVLDDKPVHSHDFVPAEQASKSPEAQSEGEGKSTDGEGTLRATNSAAQHPSGRRVREGGCLVHTD